MSDDYEVGYGKPPKGTRFPPGKSGNPSGRKKKAPSLVEDLAYELKRKHPVAQNGKTELLTMQRLAIRRAVTNAVQGDMKALNWIDSIQSRAAASNDSSPQMALSANDQEILAMLLAELKQDPGAFDDPE